MLDDVIATLTGSRDLKKTGDAKVRVLDNASGTYLDIAQVTFGADGTVYIEAEDPASSRPIDILREQLAKPVGREDGWRNPDFFDPWAVFDGMIYGSYSSDFDDMAILVLENIVAGRWGADHGEGLAHKMFREMLCVARLCTYGTSPRGCFPDYVDGDSTKPLLEALLVKWREYRDVEWAE